MDCAICLEKLTHPPTQLEKMKRLSKGLPADVKCRKHIQKLSCNHEFHQNCIRKWFRMSGICPLCRCEDTTLYRRPSLIIRVYLADNTERTTFLY
jgi:hypothetical protein